MSSNSAWITSALDPALCFYVPDTYHGAPAASRSPSWIQSSLQGDLEMHISHCTQEIKILADKTEEWRMFVSIYVLHTDVWREKYIQKWHLGAQVFFSRGVGWLPKWSWSEKVCWNKLTEHNIKVVSWLLPGLNWNFLWLDVASTEEEGKVKEKIFPAAR